MSTLLLSPLKLRELTSRNRIVVSPMCMYSSFTKNGMPSAWHHAHLGSMAMGGSGIVMIEATGVTLEGRISVGCLSLHTTEHANAFKPITEIIKSQGAIPAIQLAHAGRKGSFSLPSDGNRLLSVSEGGWQTRGPSAIAFSDSYNTPTELTKEEILEIVNDFKKAAELAKLAGFEIIEGHAAHGYLMHEFLSPLSNKRSDEFGGSLENRMRFPLMVAKTLRETWPKEWPVFFRISATDWTEGGWSIDESVIFAKKLKELEIDLIDTSTGGNVADAKIPVGPNYQVEFSQQIKHKAEIKTGAVGLITEFDQAESILQKNEADMIFLARALLRNPNWPRDAAVYFKEKVPAPAQYARAYHR